MGNLASQQLNTTSDPALVLQQALQRREQQFAAIQNPQQQLAARLGGLLGGGLVNVAQDRGFFDINDPLLNRVTQIQGIYNQVAQRIDPASNPAEFFSALSSAYSEAGMGQQAMLAMQEAQKTKKESIATQAAEFELFKKNPEIISKELQALVPAMEQGDPKAMQRYDELSKLMVRATAAQNLEEESKRSDIEYKRALGGKAAKENVQLQPLMNAAGMRIGTEIYEDGVLTGVIKNGVYTKAGATTAPAAPAAKATGTSGGRPMTGKRDWTAAYDN